MWKFGAGCVLGYCLTVGTIGFAQFFGQDDPYGYNQQQNRWNQEEILQEQKRTNELLQEQHNPFLRPC